MTLNTSMSSKPYDYGGMVGYMNTISERLQLIIAEMEGPDRGKQVRLAEIAKCTRATISHYLKNPGTEMGYEYARNISDALGYSVEWIITGRGDPKKRQDVISAPAVTLTYVNSEENILLTLYRESAKSGQVYILESAKMTEKLPRVNIGSNVVPHKP